MTHDARGARLVLNLTRRPFSIEDDEVSRPSVSSSTVRYESRTTIDRTIEEVFARLADLPTYNSWMHRTGLFPSLGRPDRKGDGVLRRHQDGHLPR